jgi:hypothetical protein
MPAKPDKRKVFRAFNPREALLPHDPRYVDFSVVRGSSRLLARMAETIRLADDHTCQLISGHTGCGKTTELLRLKDRLQSGEPRFFTLLFDINDIVDPADVDAADILLAVAKQVYTEAAKLEVKPVAGRFQAFWEEIGDILQSTVNPTEIKTGWDKLFEMKWDIKRNPSQRSQVRQHLQARTSNLLDAINEILQAVTEGLRPTYEGAWSSLDRVVRKPIPNTNRTSHEALFIDSAIQLRGLNCHMIYTVPTSLIHSREGGNLAPLYGMRERLLPMVPVVGREGAQNQAALAKLQEAVEVRLTYAATTIADTFDAPQTMEDLCAMSGGDIRGLMRLMQAAITYTEEMPITAQALKAAMRDERNACLERILGKDWEILSEVRQTKTITEAESCLEMLENLTILEFWDDVSPWHDVHPLLWEALASHLFTAKLTP